MSDNRASNLLALAAQAFNSEERVNAQEMLDNIDDYLIPNHANTLTVTGSTTTKGSKRTKKIFDSTGPLAVRDLAAILFSTMSPPTKSWTRIAASNPKLNNNTNVSKWYDEVTKIIHASLSESNLYKAIGTGYITYCSNGNMVIFHEERKKDKNGRYAGVTFGNLPVSQCAWSENSEGMVDAIHRRVRMTARQVVERFPESTPDEVHKIMELNPEEEVHIVHCIYPRKASAIKVNALGMVDAKNRKYGSYFIHEATATMLEEDGYNEFPVHVCRFDTLPGEVIGRGPGHTALPDVITLNGTVRDIRSATELAIKPPYLATSRNIMSNNLDLRPNGMTYVRRITDIQQLKNESRFDVGQIEVNDLRDSIRRTFMLDKLLLPPRQETGEMSAFEIARRVEEAQRVLGPVPSRIESELLKPLIIRQFRIMLEAGALPPIPSELANTDLEVDIQIISQLSRAQHIEEVSAIQQGLQLIMGLAQINPDAVDLIDVDEAGRSGLRILGVSEAAIAGDEAVAAAREQRQQMQQAQMQADLQLKQADAQSKMK